MSTWIPVKPPVALCRGIVAFAVQSDSLVWRRSYTIRTCCLSLLLAALVVAPATASTNTPDPAGDTFGSGPVRHDIILVATDLTTELNFTLSFANNIARPTSFQANALAGFIDLDVDNNPSTGIASHVGQLGQGAGGLGVDYFVDLFSEGDTLLPDGVTPRGPGKLDLVDASTATAVAVLSANYGPNTLSVNIPVNLLAGMGIPVHWGIVVGTFNESTDELLGSTVPEPSTAALFLWGAVMCSLCNRKRRVGF